MKKIREIVAYKHYFEEFLSEQPKKVQDKIFKIIEAIETLERIPQNYLKHLEGPMDYMKLESNLGPIFGGCSVFLIRVD